MVSWITLFLNAENCMQENLGVPTASFAGCKLQNSLENLGLLQFFVIRNRMCWDTGLQKVWNKELGRDICHLKQKLKILSEKNGRIPLE